MVAHCYQHLLWQCLEFESHFSFLTSYLARKKRRRYFAYKPNSRNCFSIINSKIATKLHTSFPLTHNNPTSVGMAFLYSKYLIKIQFQFIEEIVSISDTKEERNVGLINPKEIQTDGYISTCYTYVGSLTVPPCSEGVLWIIDKRVSFHLYYMLIFLFLF